MATVYYTEETEFCPTEDDIDLIGHRVRDYASNLATGIPLEILDNWVPDGKIHITLIVYAN